MARRRIHVGQYGEIDAVDFDLAVDQRADDFVVAAGKGKRKFLRHDGFLNRLKKF